MSPTVHNATLAPLAQLVDVSIEEANTMLVAWDHKMGPLRRGDQRAWCHALIHEDRPVAVVTTSYLIRENVAGLPMLVRDNTCELSRLCAARPGLCRVMLRMWREFVFPGLPFEHAISYQDADLHNGNTYRFDGWRRIGYSSSGTDSRSGRKGRRKWIWGWACDELFEVAA